MNKQFNISAVCQPDLHYMVDISGRLQSIKNMVDSGQYFTINRARQYGKTTTLEALSNLLKNEYTVINMDFQMMSSSVFETEQSFVSAFSQDILDNMEELPTSTRDSLLSISNNKATTLPQLFKVLSEWCRQSEKPIVLIIDEVDNASNNQVFLDFLAQLRGYYIKRRKLAAFHSVILAGVYDIKNLKLKIRQPGEHQYNSPWNIATQFNVDMSFSAEDISSMLRDYENDHASGMNIVEVASCIYNYTKGYPYLVSAICKIIAEEIGDNFWTTDGVTKAVGILLHRPNTLFDDMIKKIAEYPELATTLRKILFDGIAYPFNTYEPSMNVGLMFGFICEDQGNVAIANRIFEMHLYSYFLAEDIMYNRDSLPTVPNRNQFISNGNLDMDFVMKKFCEYYTEIYTEKDIQFVEQNGRKLFLLFLKPIINGTGNFYVESQTRDETRTDVIVDYLGKQYIIELKIWRGQQYNADGERQLIDYLNQYQHAKGYLLTFNFNKNKTVGISEKIISDKIIMEITV